MKHALSIATVAELIAHSNSPSIALERANPACDRDYAGEDIDGLADEQVRARVMEILREQRRVENSLPSKPTTRNRGERKAKAKAKGKGKGKDKEGDDSDGNDGVAGEKPGRKSRASATGPAHR